jgi:hypothetical protein
MLREGILSSLRISMLDAEQEVFYRRLMSVVDDYGRYYAHPELIQSACYPLAHRRASADDIALALEACEQASLLTLYSAPDGKDYLVLRDFRQHVRARTSKFPDPPDMRPPPKPRARRAEKVDTETGEIIPTPQEPSDTPPELPPLPPAPPAPAPLPTHASPPPPAPLKTIVSAAELTADGLTPETAIDWLAHRKARKAVLTHAAWRGIKREAEQAHWNIEDACTIAMARGWTGFSATWLERERPQRGNGNGHETNYQRAARERMEEFAPSIAAKAPGSVVDVDEVQDVTFRAGH